MKKQCILLLVMSCYFHNLSESAKDQFIPSCYSTKLKQNFLNEKDITLEKYILIGLDMEVGDNPKTKH